MLSTGSKTTVARKTKAETQRTRQQIIDAARKMFFHHGIARTTLEAIAAEAGVTRGAVYWHFQNKVALFFALREQTVLPIVDHINDMLLEPKNASNPLDGIEQALLAPFTVLERDEVAREVFQIMQLRCEYVGEFAAVAAEFEGAQNSMIRKFSRGYRCAQAKGLLRAGLRPSWLALDSVMFLSALIRRYLLTKEKGMGQSDVSLAIRSHLALRRA